MVSFGIKEVVGVQLIDTGLTKRLRAIALVSPFTSITDVILDYTTLAFIPFMARLGRIPGLTSKSSHNVYESEAQLIPCGYPEPTQ